MCLSGRSRFCLICLLLYTWIPSGQTTPEQGETTSFSSTNAPAGGVAMTTEGQDDHLEMKQVEPSGYFVDKIFERYGGHGEMGFEGLEHLMENLGLGQIFITDHEISDHKNGTDFVSFHRNHNHTEDQHHEHSGDHNHEDSLHQADLHDHDDHEHPEAHDHDHPHEHDNDNGKHAESDSHVHRRAVANPVQLSECFSAAVMLKLFDIDRTGTINESLFRNLCPALIYQLDIKACKNGLDLRSLGHLDDDHDHEHAHEAEYREAFDISKIPVHVWGYSTVAVVIISLVGLLGVAVIPIMRKVFYNHLLQFLVALAVGALSGDALLHLLPHSLAGGHEHGTEGEIEGHDPSGVYKGLCALGGIYFFFIMERLLTIFTDRKRKRKAKNKQKQLENDVFSPEKIVGEKLANRVNECDEMVMVIHPNKALREYADAAHKEHCHISLSNTTSLSHYHDHHSSRNNSGQNNRSRHNSSRNNSASEAEVETMLSGAHNTSHSHSHHCQDGIPNSVSAIAWMVIFGDGIHNFSDGLAIGAAFANSTTGGFSTSIAVFCHELPHEIGDFAVLLRAGMSVKQAIIYNCVSSLLCFVGMLIGVCLGNISSASLWIFAIVGGMFLYIALVDMLPEMTSVDTKKGENPYFHLVLQCMGMLLGAGIMLLIAIYEERLHNLLG